MRDEADPSHIFVCRHLMRPVALNLPLDIRASRDNNKDGKFTHSQSLMAQVVTEWPTWIDDGTPARGLEADIVAGIKFGPWRRRREGRGRLVAA